MGEALQGKEIGIETEIETEIEREDVTVTDTGYNCFFIFFGFVVVGSRGMILISMFYHLPLAECSITHWYFCFLFDIHFQFLFLPNVFPFNMETLVGSQKVRL